MKEIRMDWGTYKIEKLKNQIIGINRVVEWLNSGKELWEFLYDREVEFNQDCSMEEMVNFDCVSPELNDVSVKNRAWKYLALALGREKELRKYKDLGKVFKDKKGDQ